MNRIVSKIRKLFLTGLLIALLMGSSLYVSASAWADSLPPGEYEYAEPAPTESGYGYSPYLDNPPQQVFWGDTHLHTVYSFDAGAAGTLSTPETSYRFARGQVVTTDAGEPVQLSRPLDFLVVTDHTDGLGAFSDFYYNPVPDNCGDDQELVEGWYEDIHEGGDAAASATNEIISAFSQGDPPLCMLPTRQDFRTAWNEEVDMAEAYNDPGVFTAVIGYEWTSLESGNNLHRNVLFRDNGKKAKVFLPKTTEDGPNPELLWNWMENYENKTGGNVLAIPHNGNISNGLMFADTMFADNKDPNGDDLSPNYAQRRQLWEPLYEVIQLKGAGETHPYLSPDDEFASFEIAGWDNGNLDLTYPKNESMYEHEYARAALKNGLKFEETLGANPFKFGMVGSTDSHIAISGVEEDSFMGKFPIYAPSPDRAAHSSKASSFNKTQLMNKIDEYVPDVIQDKIGEKFPDLTLEKIGGKLKSKGLTKNDIPDRIKEKSIPEVKRFGWQYGGAGYVGVWAHENTRKSLFDALERREVYATSGPRMVVRLFGGWNFTDDDLNRNPGDVGYAKGVPMGSDLDVTEMLSGQKPTFLVAALKDPLRANLDRIQIVKGWLDANGDTQEKVYDVAWSDGRVPNVTTGKLPPVGSIVNPKVTEPSNDTGTVNTDTATWTNSIGASELAKVWTDEDFDPNQRAFYYARVLEIPTPRWTDYDKAFFGDDWCAEAKEEDSTACDDIPLTLQERVYTSPIWYSPA